MMGSILIKIHALMHVDANMYCSVIKSALEPSHLDSL